MRTPKALPRRGLRSAFVLLLGGTATACYGTRISDILPDRYPDRSAPVAAAPEPDTAFEPGPELGSQPYGSLYLTDTRFLYRDATFGADADDYLIVRPIDRVFETLRDADWKCLSSRRLIWRPESGRTTPFTVIGTKQVVIECDGNCDDLVLDYRVSSGQVTHHAMSQPVPVLTFHTGWGDTRLEWFAVHRGAQPAPAVRFHLWGRTGDMGPGCDIDPMQPSRRRGAADPSRALSTRSGAGIG